MTTPLSLLAVLLLALSCGKTPSGRGAGEVVADSSGSLRFRVETVARGLTVPWSIAFAPDGRMIVTERIGRIRVIRNGALEEKPLAVIPAVDASGEGGLMGLVLHPDFASNGYLYVAYTYMGDDRTVKVVRYRESNGALVEPRTIIDGIPGARNHDGCRLGFGPDGKLYVTTGDGSEKETAQQMNSLNGKTLRLNDDGSVPSDNPFVGQSGVRPEIWSYGHRNAQGIDWQPGSGLMFQTEHGPSGGDAPGGGDEINIVERGANYGWPLVHHRETRAGTVAPLLEYTPAVAPAGGTFYDGSAFAALNGNFLFACLRGECLIRVVLNGRQVVSQERLLTDYGRLRDVVQGPDGMLYVAVSNRDGRGRPREEDDRILRLVPE